MSIYNLISLLGIFGFMLVAWVFSKNRRNINWRVVFWGVVLQLLFAFFVFRLPLGLFLFNRINAGVIKILSHAFSGMYFVFGPLAVSPGTTGPGGEKSLGFILAFQALPAVIFFSALMSLLYYIGLMQRVVRFFSYIFTKLMRISGAEALCTSSNIIVGIESVFTIRPYVEEMTLSELCTLLTAGMATIASTVMAIYVGFLSSQFPTIAGHLVSASILSAPAAIVMSKLLYPESEKPKTLGEVVTAYYEKPSNWVEAIINASYEGVKLVVGIVALLLSFLGLLAMVNWLISILGHDLSLQKILFFLYYPLTLMMGVLPADAAKVSWLLGERTIVTELVSYQHLSQYISNGILTNPRSIIITAYSLCGFSHIASLAIFVGGISALAPKRAKDLAKLGFQALFAATLACLMTGAVAGVFTDSNAQSHLSKDFKALREKMVREQIEARGIKDKRVLEAIRKIERHKFVPLIERHLAYEDTPLPIGEGQTISQPYIVALMTELLQLKGNEKVLEIGTGSGYQAAILAELAREVYTIEILPKLTEGAQRLLTELDYKNIKVKCGDGYLGWPEFSPFDAIIVTCAPEEVPKALIEQLAEGGRLVIPVGGTFQQLKLLIKRNGKIESEDIIPVIFVPMIRK